MSRHHNGVKPWQWNPTKWLIWSFSKIGMTSSLRRARAELVSSSEAKVRGTVSNDQVTSEAGEKLLVRFRPQPREYSRC
jgi:hypothetical protein